MFDEFDDQWIGSRAYTNHIETKWRILYAGERVWLGIFLKRKLTHNLKNIHKELHIYIQYIYLYIYKYICIYMIIYIMNNNNIYNNVLQYIYCFLPCLNVELSDFMGNILWRVSLFIWQLNKTTGMLYKANWFIQCGAPKIAKLVYNSNN